MLIVPKALSIKSVGNAMGENAVKIGKGERETELSRWRRFVIGWEHKDFLYERHIGFG
jgi:hypothetical protein